MDTKFSVALHVLTMISESEKTLSSEDLARSVGTNASYIRKIITLLKKADILSSQRGKPGYQLTRPAENISLLDIYLAVQESHSINLFHTHHNANEECPVGAHILQAVNPIFEETQRHLAQDLAQQSLRNVITNLYTAAGKPPPA